MRPLMRLKGQYVYDDSKYLRFHIRKPFWSAGDKELFGWNKSKRLEDRIPGLGISEAIVKKAESMGRNLKVTFYRNRKHRYTITPSLVRKRAEMYQSYYIARHGIRLLVVPVDSFEHEVKERHETSTT